MDGQVSLAGSKAWWPIGSQPRERNVTLDKYLFGLRIGWETWRIQDGFLGQFAPMEEQIMHITDNVSQPTMSQTPFNINVRKDIVWDFSDVPVEFDKTALIVTYFWAGLVVAGPPVERFFIRALKPTLDTIKGDSKLKQDVEDMIAQEIQHSAAHIKLTRHLESIGYDCKAATAFVERVLSDMTRGLSPVDMLGVVAAGEHSLYAIANVFINSPDLRARLHPQVDRLFSYHFLEEAEHGAVSHDQYRYFVGNNYWHRIRMAYRARYVFKMLTGVIDIFAQGFGYRLTWRDKVTLLRYQWGDPGLMRKMSGRLMEYLSPTYKLTFEHEQLDLIERWNAEIYAQQPKSS